MRFYQRLKYSLVVILLSLLLWGCEQDPIAHLAIKADYVRPVSPGLPDTESRLRQATISELFYELNLDITQQSRYAGTIELRFNYLPSDYPLTIDFHGGEVERVWVNNTPVGIDYNGYFLTISQDNLSRGSNQVKLLFSKSFSQDGIGLNRYFDTIDQRVYLFSNTGYNKANHLFPLLEQSDISASLTALITAYEDWHVVFTEQPVKVSDRGDFKIWRYQQELFQPENTVLIAGDWHEWQGKAGERPVNILVRDSIKENIPIRAWYSQIQQAPRAITPYIKARQQPLYIFLTPSLYKQQDYYDHLAMISEQPLLFDSGLLPDWIAVMTQQAVWGMLSAKPSFHRWSAHWISQHIVEQTFRHERKRHRYHVGRQFNQPLLTPIPRQQQGIDETLSNIPLMAVKSRLLLDGLYDISEPKDIRPAIIGFLNTPGQTTNEFLESINVNSTLAMSDWTSQWLSVGGVSTLTMNRHCEFGKIDVLTITQEAMAEVPVVRQLNLKLHIKDESGLEVRDLVMTSDRSIIRDLTQLDCDAPIVISVEPYVLIRSDNQQAQLLELARKQSHFYLELFFQDAINSQATMTEQQFATWIDLIAKRGRNLQIHRLSNMLAAIKNKSRVAFASSEIVRLARNRLANQLYNYSLDTNRRLSDRIDWFTLHIEFITEKPSADRLFAWLTGQAPPQDLGQLAYQQLAAYQRLLILNHEQVELLYDYLNQRLTTLDKVHLEAILMANEDSEKQLAYLSELLQSSDYRPSSYGPALTSMSNKPAHEVKRWLPYVLDNLARFEERVGGQFLQRWLQPLLIKQCVMGNLAGAVVNPDEQLTLFSKTWLSQVEPACRLQQNK